jgi:hypothetical protein
MNLFWQTNEDFSDRPKQQKNKNINHLLDVDANTIERLWNQNDEYSQNEQDYDGNQRESNDFITSDIQSDPIHANEK